MRLRLPLISLTRALVLAATVAPSAALAKPRMLVGLQDDPSLRWRPDRKAAFSLAQQAHTGIVRTTVYWSRIAATAAAGRREPVRPGVPLRRPRRVRAQRRHARDGSDADDLGHAEVGQRRQGPEPRAGQARGPAEVRAGPRQPLLRPPPGYPFVRYYTVWNESNLGLFLSPQYNPRTKKAVAPRIYAGIYRAAYAGIKAGNPHALVGIGETSARGRDRYLGQKGVQETSLQAASRSASPGRGRS